MSIRSIGCFGFEQLDLVNPRNIWPNDKGIKSAKHFEKIAQKVKTFSSIPDAIKKSDVVIATTRGANKSRHRVFKGRRERTETAKS